MDNLACWLALHYMEGVGPATCKHLISITGSAQALFEQAAALDDELFPPQLLRQLRHPDHRAIEQALRWSQQTGNTILSSDNPDYPALLSELNDAPPVLFVRGDPGVLSDTQIAIVGSRNPTVTGTESARDFAQHFSRIGLTVTSGLALGIDAAAHQAAVDTRKPTIAVMGTGIDNVYPRRNRRLADAILEQGGALVSELPLGAPPLRENFPRRNRIISGLALGTLVIEAARQSGSLITARLAAEQGREVFAIPGSIHNPLSRGCHQLIRQGAKLVESAEDVLEELTHFSAITTTRTVHSRTGKSLSTLDPEHQSVLTCVGFEPTAIDTVVSRSGLTANAVSSMLLVLELQDFVQSHIGGLYSRKK